MKVFFNKIPLALSSLVLALFSLSNQISQYTLFSQGIWLIAVFGFFLVLGRPIIGYRQTQEDLHNPVIASAFPSFFMAAFLFAGRLPLAQADLSIAWIVVLIGLYIAYIIFFSLRFLRPLVLEQVYPSWFVVYVGPAISLVTIPDSIPNSTKALILGLTGLATLALFPLIFWRIRRLAIPQPVLPILAILAAPLALLITSSIKSGQKPDTILLVGLLIFSQLFFFFALGLFTRLVNKGFVPLFAAFSFPLVNSINAFKAATTSLGLVNPATQLVYKVEFVFVLVIMTYLLYHFLKLLYKALIQALNTKKQAGSV
ncbi:ethanolamine utilization protein EutJ [Streptococcus thermophilus]|jgi:exfoliative toxin A/B|uniref:ethanolamine utilization protein EutJ n=1 Tax=Streptococcus thermophilus TaxID=1308 RepID=UPI000742D646|nr:ethanolamine utilization protein EutJ [Streptococcus thermophilus]ALX90649.1 ethanolamine utilization protein EutJ [Streptococcus thermophilus]MBW7795960.1 ethanolamine utilization protein EutJ [Streptococcus thermophilus]MCT2904061.1 ethanolamine utilization protein EutJ [Streptococcus thermophilus]MCT2925057.1 ethanolamine utilization protein EutJ [Streptococcus thermophilus]MCT2926608.1 ethanolamine utilization protein EutJ [Streptococcus thermophilus]